MIRSKEINTCYQCNRTETSKEHVPPKCIFPVTKDIPDKNLRKNLIKVPSCDFHNLQKSKDDEFLMIMLASSVRANNLGFRHFSTKINRALKRKPENFLNQIVNDYEKVLLETKSGNKISCYSGIPNIERLDRCFNSIVRGLFFHNFKKKFSGKIFSYYDFLLFQTKNKINFRKLMLKAFERDPKETSKLGDNQDVFYYQFSKRDQFGMGLKMTFYGNLNVIASLNPTGSPKPFDFATAMMLDGNPVTYNIDGEEIKFNEKSTK